MGKTIKINILLCDTFPGLLPDFIPSYASMFFDLFNSVSDNVSFEVFPVMQSVWPTSIQRDQIYLITGCNRSVYEDEGWIVQLLQWIREAHAVRAKVIGICFGHQAIAQALGGKVERYSGGWGVGIRASQVTDDEFAHCLPDGQMRLLYNHHDQVTRLPEGATVLASSPFCRYEALRIGHNIYSFQGHPEYTPEYELHLLRLHADNEDPEVKRRATISIEQQTHQGAIIAAFLLEQLS